MYSTEEKKARRKIALARYNASDKRKATRARYNKTKKAKELNAIADKRYATTDKYKVNKQRNEKKIIARDILNKAKRAGRIKPAPCANCGNKKTQAHHADYTKPLEVVWLCVKCHRRAHAA